MDSESMGRYSYEHEPSVTAQEYDILEKERDELKRACYELIEEYEKIPKIIKELVVEQVYIGRVIIGMKVSKDNEKQLLKIKEIVSKA